MGGVAPNAVGATANLTNNLGAGQQIITLDGVTNITLGTLAIGDSTTNDGSFLLVPGTATSGLVLDATGIASVNLNKTQSTRTDVIAVPITLNDNLGSNVTTGVLQVNGAITGGTNTLSKTGGGVLFLRNANTFGSVSIAASGGTLQAGNAAALGSGTVSVAGGGLAAGAGTQKISNTVSLGATLTLGLAGTFDGLDLAGGVGLGSSPRTISATTSQNRISGAITQASAGLSVTITGASGGEVWMTNGGNNYNGGTVVSSGTLRVQGAGLAGVNTALGTISVSAGASLRLEGTSNLGSNQVLTLNNSSATSAPLLGLGAGFNNLGAGAVGFDTTGSGIQNIRVSPGSNPVVVALDGARQFNTDIFNLTNSPAAASAPIWLGATNFNGTYTGTTLTAGQGSTYRLGAGSGTLTIANSNVLVGSNNLIVGATTGTGVTNVSGTVYLPNAQSFTGSVTIGSGGTLVTGGNSSLGNAANAVTLIGGTLDLRFSGQHGANITEYSGRDLTVSASSTLTTGQFAGGTANNVHLKTVTFSATGLTLTSTVNNSTNLVIDGATTLRGGGTNTISTGGAVTTLAGGISQVGGTANLTKAGTGVLALAGSGGYSGNTVINGNAGTTMLLNSTALSAGTLTLSGNTTAASRLDVQLNGTGSNGTVGVRSGAISVSNGTTNDAFTINVTRYDGTNSGNAVVFTNDGTSGGTASNWTLGSSTTNAMVLNVTGRNDYFAGPVSADDFANGRYTSGAGYTLKMAGGVTLTALTTSFTPTSAALEIAGVISESTAGRGITKAGTGTMTISGSSNIYSGVTTISAGTLAITSIGNGSLATSSLGTSSNLASNLVLSGGSLRYTGAGHSSDRLFSLGASSTLDASGTGALNLTNTGAIAYPGTASNRTLTLTGTNTDANTLSASMADVLPGTNTTSVSKTGAGTWTLTGGTAGNTYTGATSVSNGTLVGLARTSGTPFGTGAVNLNGGTLRLDGIGSSTTTATTGALTVGGAAKLQIKDQADVDGVSTTYSFGSLVRSGSGTLTVIPQFNRLNAEEVISFTGTAPTTTNGIIAPWAMRTTSATDLAGDFLGLSDTNPTVPTNLVTATYTNSDLNTAVAADISAVTGATLTADRSAYAIKTSGNLALAGKTLNVGSTTTASTTASFGGLILNDGADVSNGTLNFGKAEGVIYVEGGQTSTISATIRSSAGQGTVTTGNVLTKMGNGTLEISTPMVIARPDGTNNAVNTVTVSGGTLKAGAANVFYNGTNVGNYAGSTVNVRTGSTLDLSGAGFDQTLGGLAGEVNSTVNIGGNTLVVGTNGQSTTFAGQLIGGAGSKLEVMRGTLILANTEASLANSIGSATIHSGVLEVRGLDSTRGLATEQTLALPSSVTYTLKGGTLNLRHDGDGGSSNQNILFGNDLVVEKSATLSVGRPTAGDNKVLILDQMTLGSGVSLTTTSANTYRAAIAGTTTLQGSATITATNDFIMSGAVGDGGSGATLNKTGGSQLMLNSANTYSGGTVINQGVILFGTYVGNTVVYSGDANAGTGHILINPSAAIRVNEASNITAGQNLYVNNSIGNNARVDLQFDGTPSDVHLRSLSSGTLNLNSNFTTTSLNLAALGNGSWVLGAGSTTTTVYDAATLGAGAGSTYRLGGGFGATQTLTINQANVLTGANSLVVGAEFTGRAGVVSNTSGLVQLNDNQNYTGITTIHRGYTTGGTTPAVGDVLDFRGTLASPTINVFGDLRATGAGTFTDASGSQVNTVNLFVGSQLRLDYNNNLTGFNITNQSATSFTNKWGDSTAMTLNGASLRLTSGSALVTTEQIGALTVQNGADIHLERVGTNGQSTLLVNGTMTRTGQATLTLRPAAAGELGSAATQSGRFIFADPANGPTVNNGMAQAWIVNATDNSHVTYNAATGYSNVTYVDNTTGTLNVADGTSLINQTTTALTTITTGDIWALRTSQDISATTALTLRSGGLIITGSTSGTGAVTRAIAAPVTFGTSGTPVEAVIYTAGTGNNNMTGNLTAAGLTKFGPAQLTLSGNNSLTGTIQVNAGTLELRHNTGLDPMGAATKIVLGGSSVTAIAATATNMGSPVQLNLRSEIGTITKSSTDLEVAAGVPWANVDMNRVGASGTPSFSFKSLIMNVNSVAPQVFNLTGANSAAMTVAGATLQTQAGYTSGQAIIRTDTAGLTITGQITGAGTLVKAGGGQLTVNNPTNNNNYTGGTIINEGTFQVQRTNDVGTGAVTLNGGNLQFAGNSLTNAGNGNHLTVNGTAAITATAASTGGTTSTILTVNDESILSISGNSTNTFTWAGNVKLNGTPIITNSSRTTFTGTVSGDNLIKVGVENLTLGSATATANNNITGQVQVNQGTLRLVSTAATTGLLQNAQIMVNPGAAISTFDVDSLKNAAGTGSSISRFQSTSTALAVLGIGAAINEATFESATMLSSSAITSRSGVGGVLALDGGTGGATAVNLGTVYTGDWYLGSVGSSGSYTASTLGVGNNNTYRFMGTPTGTLTIQPGVATNVLVDPAGVAQNKVVIGVDQGWAANGQVTFGSNLNNAYEGGTTILRTRGDTGAQGIARLNVEGGNANATLGTGAVNVYGIIAFQNAAGTALNNAGANRNTYTFYPQSQLIFDNNTAAYSGGAAEGRWDDQAAIALNGTQVDLRNPNTAATYSETVGAITFDRGSEIDVTKQSTGMVELLASGLSRATGGSATGHGTLTVTHTTNANVADTFGIAGAVSAERIKLSSGSLTNTNNMLPAYMVSRTDDQFLTYTANGLGLVADPGASKRVTATTVSNYVVSSASPLTPGSLVRGDAATMLNDGSEILEINTADAKLAGNLDVYALRTENSILTSDDGQFNNIRIRSGGLIAYNSTSTNTRRIDANLEFRDSTNTLTEGLIFADDIVLQINGQISAASATKFGSNQLQIMTDQTQFSGEWHVNQGTLTARSLGALNSSPIFLQGGTSTLNSLNGSTLRFEFDPLTPDERTFTSGKVTSYDINTINLATGVVDRTLRMGDIDLKSTGSGSTPVIRFSIENSRNYLNTGAIKLFDNYMINVDATVSSFGAGSGVRPDSINNQGLYNLTKLGDGRLIVGDISTTFTGSKSITVNEGAWTATHATGSLGAAGTNFIVDMGGVLDVAVAGFNPDATVTMNSGAIERWSVDGARSGAVTLGTGVSLQVNANQTGTQTVTLNGGGIAGYLANDANETAVFRTLGSGVSINLASNSMVGISQPLNHVMYDVGKYPQEGSLFTAADYFRGAVLEIKGVISGAGGLTKVGPDTVILSGQNTYQGATSVTNGILRIGITNALPVGTALSTTTGATLDLNGFDQTVASLSGNGKVANSAYSFSTFTTGSSNSSTTFAGDLSGALNVTKVGNGTLTLSGSNSFVGTLAVNGGKVLLDASSATNLSNSVLSLNASLAVNGGTLELKGKSGAAVSQTVNGLTVMNNASTVNIDNNGGTSTTLNLGAITRTGTGTVNFSATGGALDTTTRMITTTNSLDSSGILAPWAFVGNSFATKSGNNIVAYTGGTSGDLGSNGGGDDIASGSTIAAPGPAGVQSDLTAPKSFAGLQLESGVNVNMTGTGSLTLTGGGLLLNNAGGTMNGGTIAGSAGGELLAQTNSNFTINSQITDNGSATGLTKSGAGTLTLGNAANSYTGPTNIVGGTLQLGTSGVIPDGSRVNIANGPSAAAIDLNGQTETVGSLNSTGSGTAGTVNLNGGSLITGADATTDGDYAGSITGNGSFTKTGGGTQTLSGASNFTGTTTVSGGRLTVSSPTALGTGGNTPANGTSVDPASFLRLQNVTVSGEHLTLNGSGRLEAYGGSSTWTGSIVVSNSPFDVDTGSTLTVTGQISGTGGITKLGGGTLELGDDSIPIASAANSFQGAVIVDAGTLSLNRVADTGAGSTGNFGSNIPNSSSGVTVNGGTLIWNSDHQVGNAVAVTLNGNSLSTVTLDLNGYTETMGALTLTSDSVIDLAGVGPGGLVAFLSSGAWNPSATLAIWNYTGAIYTGLGATSPFQILGLTEAQLDQLRFFSGAGVGAIGTAGGYNNLGEVVPVPEPSAVLSLGFLIGLIGWRERGLFIRRRKLTGASNQMALA